MWGQQQQQFLVPQRILIASPPQQQPQQQPPLPSPTPSIISQTQPNDIPPFRGDESPDDAEKWFGNVVACTGSFSDSGIFRFLFTKFPAGSVAWEWLEALDDVAKTSWIVFQREFRSKWITEAQILNFQAAWDAFAGHILREDAIFGGVMSDMQSSISTWVADHVQLAKATDREDSVLIETTNHLLPAFIQAYLQIHFDSLNHNLDEYCSAISNIPANVLDLERIRRKISSKDQMTAIERRVEENSEQIKQLVATLNQWVVHIPSSRPLPTPHDGSVNADQPSEINISSRESIAWESCSPVTSVMSMNLPSGTSSELATPTGELATLPDPGDDSLNQSHLPLLEGTEHSAGGDTQDESEQMQLFRCPASWRKTQNSITRQSLIATTQKAIELMLTFKSGLDAHQSSILKSSTTFYDILTGGRSNKLISFPNLGGYDGIYKDLFSAILGVHLYSAYEDVSYVAESMRIWDGIAEGNSRSYYNVITTHQRGIQGYYTVFHVEESGETSMAGGLLSGDCVTISSVWTIPFMTLSSYLAECSGEGRHREMAILSAKCVKRWMLDPATTLIKNCLVDSSNTKEKSGATLSSYLTGIVIEGFSVLSSVTGDKSWRTLAIDIAVASMNHAEWHESDGILTVGSDEVARTNSDVKAFKGLLNRGLLVAYQRNRSNKSFCNLVRSYINVQCNALLELSRFKNSYGVDWRGPYAGPYAHAQMAAIDTLVAAIGVNDNED